MRRVTLADPSDLGEWRGKARALLLAGVEPVDVDWEGMSLFGGDDAIPPPLDAPAPAVPRDFLNLANTVLAHSDPRRHAVLYRMLLRLTHGEKGLLAIATDDDVSWAHTCVKQVNRDMHKMKAFVRFREVARGAVPPGLTVTTLRSAPVIGASSALLVTLRRLVERLPVLPLGSWIEMMT